MLFVYDCGLILFITEGTIKTVEGLGYKIWLYMVIVEQSSWKRFKGRLVCRSHEVLYGCSLQYCCV